MWPGISGTVGDTTLTVSQMTKHNHSGDTVNLPLGYDGLQGAASYNTRVPQQGIGYSGGSQPHTHSLSGESGEADSLPPYYALALIMRIA